MQYLHPAGTLNYRSMATILMVVQRLSRKGPPGRDAWHCSKTLRRKTGTASRTCWRLTSALVGLLVLPFFAAAALGSGTAAGAALASIQALRLVAQYRQERRCRGAVWEIAPVFLPGAPGLRLRTAPCACCLNRTSLADWMLVDVYWRSLYIAMRSPRLHVGA